MQKQYIDADWQVPGQIGNQQQDTSHFEEF